MEIIPQPKFSLTSARVEKWLRRAAPEGAARRRVTGFSTTVQRVSTVFAQLSTVSRMTLWSRAASCPISCGGTQVLSTSGVFSTNTVDGRGACWFRRATLKKTRMIPLFNISLLRARPSFARIPHTSRAGSERGVHFFSPALTTSHFKNRILEKGNPLPPMKSMEFESLFAFLK